MGKAKRRKNLGFNYDNVDKKLNRKQENIVPTEIHKKIQDIQNKYQNIQNKYQNYKSEIQGELRYRKLEKPEELKENHFKWISHNNLISTKSIYTKYIGFYNNIFNYSGVLSSFYYKNSNLDDYRVLVDENNEIHCIAIITDVSIDFVLRVMGYYWNQNSKESELWKKYHKYSNSFAHVYDLKYIAIAPWHLGQRKGIGQIMLGEIIKEFNTDIMSEVMFNTEDSFIRAGFQYLVPSYHQNQSILIYSSQFYVDPKKVASSYEKNKQNIEIENAKEKLELACNCMDEIKEDQLANLEKAINLLLEASQVFKINNLSTGQAMAESNLGICYCDLYELYKGTKFRELMFLGTTNFEQPIEEEENIYKYIEKAISHFESALALFDINETPRDWALCHQNLGTAYLTKQDIFNLRNLKNKSLNNIKKQNLETALEHFEAALTVLTKENDPQEWATVQLNMGNVYGDFWQVTNDNLSSYYQLAQKHYQQALEIYNKNDYPNDWALIQNNLAYLEKDYGNPKEAINHFQSASEVNQEQNNLIQYLKSTRNQGNVAYFSGKWEEAIESFEKTIDSIEKLRITALSDQRRQEIISYDLDIYLQLIDCYIKTQKFDKAFETIERSRSRYLVDLMAGYYDQENNQIPSPLQQKLNEYEELQKQINNLLTEQKFNHKITDENKRAALTAQNEDIAKLEQKKQELWLKIRELDPVLAGEIKVNPLNINQIRKLITNFSTAIINIYSSLGKTYIFILTQEQISCHICNHQNTSLQNFIYENWLKLYIKEHSKWCNQLPDLLSEISEKLALNKLIENHLKGIKELIIIPHIYLHLIPFAALPINNQETVGDRFLIRYAPSCQILEFCVNRPNITENLNYGLIENATEDLPCTDFEGKKIAEIFNIPDSQRLKGSEQATIKNYRNLTEKVNILHSSHHAESRLDNPLESHLKLADGNITLGQLLTPNWRMPNISDVFLSCCETNLGLTEITDDILTLATGFLCAGARSVISTLWAVDDLATALFAIIYYQNRQQGLNRVESLQRTQIELRTMTGEYLASNYQPELKKILTEKLEKSYTNCKQIKKQKSQLPEDSLERQNLDRKYEQFDKQYQKIGKTRKRLDDICKQDYPFKNPVFWAAFVIHGLS